MKKLVFMILTLPIIMGFANISEVEICILKCKYDTMDINQCIEDKENYWDTTQSYNQIRRACIDLIRNERLYCESGCYKKDVLLHRTLNFYDTQVKNFPEVNQ
jgi:hypothetical protein